VADAVGDIVARDIENLPVIGHATDHDMGVGMAGVVVIDRDPIELGIEVAFHLLHEPAREVSKVPQLGGVLGCHDETELVAVILASVEELRSVRLVQARRIEPAALALQGHAIALQVAEMGIGRLAAAAAQLHHPRLDHDTARAEAHAALGPAPAALAREGGNKLAAPAARVEAACLRRSAPRTAGATDAARIAAGAGDRAHDLLREGAGRPRHAPIASAADAAQAWLEAGIVVAGHGENIRTQCREDKSLHAPLRKTADIST
jgi:hypothetical protein